MKERTISAPEGATFSLRLFFGANLNGSLPKVDFAWAPGAAAAVGDAPDPCEVESKRGQSAFQVTKDLVQDQDEEHSGLLTVKVSSIAERGADSGYSYLCVLNGDNWANVGPYKLRISPDRSPERRDYIPPWGLALLMVLLLLICGLLRTVNLSLLWLDPVELYVLHSCGSEEEKRAAKRLEPVRRRGNFLVSLSRRLYRPSGK